MGKVVLRRPLGGQPHPLMLQSAVDIGRLASHTDLTTMTVFFLRSITGMKCRLEGRVRSLLSEDSGQINASIGSDQDQEPTTSAMLPLQ